MVAKWPVTSWRWRARAGEETETTTARVVWGEKTSELEMATKDIVRWSDEARFSWHSMCVPCLLAT